MAVKRDTLYQVAALLTIAAFQNIQPEPGAQQNARVLAESIHRVYKQLVNLVLKDTTEIEG